MKGEQAPEAKAISSWRPDEIGMYDQDESSKIDRK
jgi:hypothetical protein